MVALSLITLATLLGTALANPVPVPSFDVEIPAANASEVDKRQAAEGVYLLNCGPPSNPNTYHPVVHCPDISNCGRIPSNNNLCYGPTKWETSTGSCRFPTGVTFTWNIVANAQEFPYFAVVGSGNNGRPRPFTIRKDNQGVLYRDSQGYDCRAIYVAV
ncbi:hypothetical protein QC764_115500 [Podospora pseudoanserina]|uniref:Ig-like domain-containing protein n=1 Tax=Podospora pseudoanserina TaxID=2609844 RepID=A0ABR0IR82_9PEZI|nr:hypothetical protein QC764_115500 [Podospora pseudoanserina]